MMNHAVMTEIDIEKENKAIAQEYKELLSSVIKRCLKKTKLIRKAFDVSVEAHKEQRRKIRGGLFSIPLLWQNSRFGALRLLQH
jgi:plasmid stabilization system protein ParE